MTSSAARDLVAGADAWGVKTYPVETAEAADPDYWKKDKRARRKEKRLPTRWNEDHTMLILDDSDSED